MPPKKKGAEPRIEEDVELVVEVERESSALDFAGHSPTSSASSARSCGSLSSAQLERILDANTKSMMALMERRYVSSDHFPEGTGIGSRVLQTRVDIPKWVEGESPSDFFGKYEQALSHNGVDRSKWGSLLQVYISGSAQASFRQINPVLYSNYDQVKKEMLESLGDTPDGADKRWFTLSRQGGENHRALFRRVHNTGYRRMDGLESKEACCDRMVLSKFLTLLSPECYASVAAMRPRNGQEAARLAQEYEEDASFARSLNPQSSGGHHSNYYRREHSNDIVQQQEGAGSPGIPKSGSGYQGRNNTPSPVLGQASGTNQLKIDKPFRQVTCYGCGELGHIRPNCPNRERNVRVVRSVKEQNAESGSFVDGLLAGVQVKGLRVDTGAEITVVHEDFIPSATYTGETVVLDSWRRAQFSTHRVARIAIQVGKVKVEAEVAVTDTLGCPALLGPDLGLTMLKELIKSVIDQVEDESACESAPSLKLQSDGFVPSGGEQVMLDEVLDGDGEVLCAIPGRNSEAELLFRTSSHDLVRSQNEVKAVSDFKFPQTKKCVSLFLGLTGYDRRFLPKFVANMTEATGKTTPGRVLSSVVLLNVFLYYLCAYALSKFF